MSKYAANTDVSVERSAAEIERTLQRYGADQFIRGWQHGSAFIAFAMNDRRIRFVLPLPDKREDQFWKTPGGRRRRDDAAAFRAWEQACRQRWRALSLCIKAKLEAVEAGIATFEEEFLAHIELPGGRTVGDWMVPQIEQAYASGKMPPLLPAASS